MVGLGYGLIHMTKMLDKPFQCYGIPKTCVRVPVEIHVFHFQEKVGSSWSTPLQVAPEGVLT